MFYCGVLWTYKGKNGTNRNKESLWTMRGVQGYILVVSVQKSKKNECEHGKLIFDLIYGNETYARIAG
jgi:hypothetical protein